MAEYPALLNAYRDGAVCLVNSFQSKLIHKKAVFAVLTNDRFRDLFDADELAAINEHVPWTRKFREEKTLVRASSGRAATGLKTRSILSPGPAQIRTNSF